MSVLWQDLRYGLRMLQTQKGITAIAVLSLALGIGANTALFSIVDAMLLRKLPVAEPERLVLFSSVSPPEFGPGSYTGNSNTDPKTGQKIRTSFPYQSLVRMREQQTALSEIFAFGNVNMNVNANGQADVANGQAVSGNYYAGLGVRPALGRTITGEDDQASAPPVAVLSYRYWQRRFGGDPAVIGIQINLNNVPFTVIGVTQPGFDGAMQVGSTLEVSIPIAWEPRLHADPERSRMHGAGVWWLRLMGRLKPGMTAEQARAGLEAAFRRSVIEHRAAAESQAQARGDGPLEPLDPKNYPRLALDSGSQGEMNTRQFYAPSLYLLLGVVALVLLIACANVANLLLSRAVSRQKEIGVRLALGATRFRLIRQFLTESVLLALIGGALGILFAVWIKDGLLTVSAWGGRGMQALEARLDWRVLGFTLGLSLLTGIVFGLAPAWRATQVNLTPALKAGARTTNSGMRSLLGRALVVLQVSLSLLLLVGAGLFLRTLHNLQRVEPGFNMHNLLLFGVEPGLIGYQKEKLTQLYRQMTERLEAIPGVQSVTFSRMPLLARGASSRGVYLPGTPAGADGKIQSKGGGHVHHTRENFLEAMGIPLLLGRPLTARDDERAPKVAVVNQTFATRYFPNQNPVGKRFGFDPKNPQEIEIVGVAKDAKYTRQRDEIPPTVYIPWLQELSRVTGVTFEVRTTGDPAASIAAIREAVREVDANLPLNNIRTQIEQADETLAMERLFARLISLFGLLAQQLASIGLYGVMAYSVSRRTQEIGIRMALGGQGREILKMILRQGMALVLAGLILGLAGAYVLTRYLESQMKLSEMLYGIQPTDPLTFGVTALILILVALIACLIPARRAARVDPMIALRHE